MEGFVDLFDGQSLRGWNVAPRLPTAMYPGGSEPDTSTDAYQHAKNHQARWSVSDRMIVGQQDEMGCYGGYLVSNAVFGDFDLFLDVWPDWPADTGVMVRATLQGSQGFQILIDHRKSGGIGGFYGNGIGGFHALSYNIDARFDSTGHLQELVEEDPATTLEPVTPDKLDLLSFAAPASAFLQAWRCNAWNTLRIRCVGRYPVLTSWINDVRIFELESGSIQHPLYDRDAVANLLGRQGHIALEVHDTDRRLGRARWGEGAICRWRNIRLATL